jgi:2-oxo-3-hexenedioate decarboxylase
MSALGADTAKLLAQVAAALDEAAAAGRALPMFPSPRGISLEEAYAVQHQVAARRIARGERLVGAKIGLTREEKWAACGARDVILGLLTDRMLIGPGEALDLRAFIAPGVEPELAFRLARPLAGNVGLEEALAAVEAVAPALEVADSRIADTAFVLTQVVADNSNSAALVIGTWQDPLPNLANLHAQLEIDNVVVAEGNTRTVSGHPARSLCAAARLMASMGVQLQAGSIVLSGGLTPARPVRPDELVACRIEGLGVASTRVEG